MAALSRLRRTVKVSGRHRLLHARLGRAMLSFTAALPELRGAGLTVASVDGKTMRGGLGGRMATAAAAYVQP